MSDPLIRTACGLYVMPDGRPPGWSNFTWTTQVVDMPGDQEEFDALSLVQNELRQVIGYGRHGATTTAIDVAFATLHAGEVTRYAHRALGFADPDVPAELADADQGGREWTVCGILRESWRTVCFKADAGHPLVAYLRAWEWARDEHGEQLLLTAVHEEWRPPIDVFGYADPWARDGAQMAAKAAEWGL